MVGEGQAVEVVVERVGNIGIGAGEGAGVLAQRGGGVAVAEECHGPSGAGLWRSVQSAAKVCQSRAMVTPSVRVRERPDFGAVIVPPDSARRMCNTRQSRSADFRAASSPRRAPLSAARRASGQVLFGPKVTRVRSMSAAVVGESLEQVVLDGARQRSDLGIAERPTSRRVPVRGLR